MNELVLFIIVFVFLLLLHALGGIDVRRLTIKVRDLDSRMRKFEKEWDEVKSNLDAKR